MSIPPTVLMQYSTLYLNHTVHAHFVLAIQSTVSLTHTHPFKGPLSGTTRVSWYQKGKTSLDFTEARDSEWQWHQLGHMQVWTALQTYSHASTPPLSFSKAGCPSCRPTNNVKALKADSQQYQYKMKRKNTKLCYPFKQCHISRVCRLGGRRRKDKVRLLVTVRALNFLQCFDTTDHVSGRASDL